MTEAGAREITADEIDLAFVPVRRADVTAVELDGEAVVLAEGLGGAHFLDELATLVWNTFDGSSSLDELAVDFAAVFGADPEVVRKDIVTLTQGIGSAGLLVGVSYEPPVEPSNIWPSGVGIGEPIPSFKLPDADGHEVTVSDLGGREVLLVNWSPRCGFCTRMASELAELQAEIASRGVELVFITLGDQQENQPLLDEYGLRPRVLFGEGSDTEVFAGVGTPAAYLVDQQGRAASELTVGADKVPDLARFVASR